MLIARNVRAFLFSLWGKLMVPPARGGVTPNL